MKVLACFKSVFFLQLSVLLMLVCFLGLSSGFAQEKGSISWVIAPILTLQPGINSLELEVNNTGEVAFEGYIQLELPPELISLVNSRVAVQIAPGKKRFLSLKLRSQLLGMLKGSKIHVSLFKSTGEGVLNQEVLLEIPSKRSVQLQDNSTVQYLRHIGDEVLMQVRVMNTGTTDEQVKILFSSPDRVGKVIFQEVDLFLPSGADTLLRRSFTVEQYMIALSQYTVRVAGIYHNSDAFGNLALFYSNIASDRNYQRMFATDRNLGTYSPNYVEFRVSNIFDRQQSYNFVSEGTYRLAGGRFHYAAGVNRWGGDSRLNVNNTYVEYENRNHSLTLGNIQESLEAPFYGRGATYSYQDTAGSHRVSVGMVQRTHDLLGYYDRYDPGFTVFGRLQLAAENVEPKRYEGQVIYDHNRMDSVNSLLWTNRFVLIRPKSAEDLQLEGFLAGGIQQYTGGYRSDQEVKPSFGAGLKMSQRKRHWSFSSDNFYSTGYFPGNRRGAVQLSQRISRHLRQIALGLGYTYSDYSPHYLNPHFSTFSSGMSRWDMQLSIPLSSHGQLRIVPSYNKEHADYRLTDSPMELSAQSVLLASTANLRSKNLKHSLFFTLEGGDMKLEQQSSHNFIFRTDFSYNYQRVSLFGNYQNGPFQVYDMMSAMVLDRPFGRRYSLGARYQDNFLQQRMSWNANITGQINTGWGRSLGSYIQAQYRIAKQTQLQTMFQYTYNMGVTNYRYDYVNLQIGLRQQFKSQDLDRPTVKSGNLQVFCYYDNNSNEIYDAGDQPAVDYGFMVRNILFVTDRKGEASFKKMPYGSYILFFPLKDQYQAGSRSVDISKGTTRLEVPLHKVGSVRGQLLLDYDPAIHLTTNLSLDVYTIVARNEQGRIFEVRSDARGFFVFQLPEGKYNIYLNTERFPQHIYIDQPAQPIEVKVGAEVQLAPFRLQIKAKAVDVKRFGKRA